MCHQVNAAGNYCQRNWMHIIKLYGFTRDELHTPSFYSPSFTVETFRVLKEKEISERLKTNTVYFEVEDDTIIVKPVRDEAGSLSEYAKNVKPGTPMKKIKEMAWQEAIREKTRKKPS